jgi:NADP-dependent 3-hydroxy acid dehydrogenase YdfG
MNTLTKSTPITKALIRPQLLTQTSRLGFASKAASADLVRKKVDGKNVIVTGSARGIGRSIALRLAADGYNVCINDIPALEKTCDEVVKEIKSMGRNACTAVGDVTNRSDVKEVVQKSVKKLGPLHTM